MNKVIYNLLVIFTIGIIGCNPKNSSSTTNNNNKPKVTTKEALQSCITPSIKLFEIKQLQKQIDQEQIKQKKDIKNKQEAVNKELQLVISNFKAAKETETDLNIKDVVDIFIDFVEKLQKAEKTYQEAEGNEAVEKKVRQEKDQELTKTLTKVTSCLNKITNKANQKAWEELRNIVVLLIISNEYENQEVEKTFDKFKKAVEAYE